MMSLWKIILPEFTIAIAAMLMQVIAVFNEKSSRRVAAMTLLLFFIIGLGLAYMPAQYQYFGKSFLSSSVINLFKAVILGLALMSLLIYYDLTKISGQNVRIEFLTITLLSTLGLFISISARDFLILFCGIELLSLSGYALTAFNTKSEKSSEAGLKYFILGALMSCIYLMGVSFLYGYSGSISFIDIKYLMNGDATIGLIFGAVLVVAALLFKLSAAPLHIWTPDVYEGAPVAAVSYFATAQKIGMLLVFLNVLDGVVGDYQMISQNLIKIVAILSMLVGAFGALGQNSLKRLLAYSSILNVGYALIAVSLHSVEGNNAAYIYMLIYAIATVGLFACFVALLGPKSEDAVFDDLRGAAKSRKALASVISILMFSMIGLPPFAGFFGKYYVFFTALQQGELLLVVIGLLTSIVSAFYYLKIVKYLYFFEEKDNGVKRITTQKGLWLVTIISVTFTLFFFSFAYKYIV